jgi:hypothetical protein
MLKKYITEREAITEKENLKSLGLVESELKAVRFHALNEDLSIKALVSLVLKDKINKEIDESVVIDLTLRKFIDSEKEITKEGRLYLESEETKTRIQNLL